MVEFVTLFLGALIAGPTRVELQVHRDVAMLEIRLDERAVATLRGAPWEVEVDFGEELEPHLLEAVAFAGNGRELGRAGQWVNLTPKEAEVTIALDRDRATHRRVARLSWQSLSEENEPVRARAVFDGEPLEVRDPRAIALPPHDLGRLHHLRVELEFPDSLRSAAEITFGGGYGERVSSGLTAVPVLLEGRRELPAVDAMQGWFRSGGRPVRVHAAEKGLAEIVVVRSPAAERLLNDVMARRKRRRSSPALSEDHRLRLVGARPELVSSDRVPFVVFPRSEEYRHQVGGLLRTLSSATFPEELSAEVRLSDAVAVAGLFANRSARRRAVVLITTRDASDASQFGPGRVRHYLRSIGVPLVVWSPEAGTREAGGWGPATDISTSRLLDRAYRELSRALDRQRILWLSGLHLPRSLVLDLDVEGVQTLLEY